VSVGGKRRFPPPWTFDEANNACFVVKDANGFAVSYVYFESEPGRRAAAKLMTKDEARRIAANIARLPELLRAEQPDANALVQRR
jgi:endo-1,4-beta-D-glucanase Y